MDDRFELDEVVTTWLRVRDASGRSAKRALMASLFRRLAPAELRIAARYLAGEIPQGAVHVGWRTLQAAASRQSDELPLFRDVAAPGAPIALVEVDRIFEQLQQAAGPGVEQRRIGALRELFHRTNDAGREFLSRLLLGELRQGALRAVVVEALAEAFELPLEALRRALMFAGDFAKVVDIAAREGAAGLARVAPRPFAPIEPMLASQAESAAAALAAFDTAAIEWKVDGVRLQLHRDGDTVRAFTRQLRDVSRFVPELLELGRRLPDRIFILDGEVTGTDPAGRPLAFQDLMSRFTREGGGATPLLARFFDVLVCDAGPLVDEPYRVRRAVLERLVPAPHRVPARIVSTPEEAEDAYRDALAHGQEGVVVKALESHYAAGRRGSQWLKVKPAPTLDLVILAAEWGHGRRRGSLSNIHLGARIDGEPGRFAMLGKTFKGLTDSMLRAMTEDLLALETQREGHVVHVRPERVVEVAFDTVQRSRRYDSGLALRFARVKRFRPDKSADEVETLAAVRRFYERQSGGSSRGPAGTPRG